MFQILVVEDDVNSGKLMEAVLEQEGFVPTLVKHAQAALDILDKQHIDLMITDLMMPGMDGYALTEQLRDAGYLLPILMVTAKESFRDKRKGFLVGTDDYMVKPIDVEEMILRVRALLRRAQIVNSHKLHIGSVVLHYDSKLISRGKKLFNLPQKEFLLLYKLLSYPGAIFTRTQLMDEIWGYDSQTDEHTVSVHIGRLRDRFETWPEFEIVTVRGLGYKAVINDEQ